MKNLNIMTYGYNLWSISQPTSRIEIETNVIYGLEFINYDHFLSY